MSDTMVNQTGVPRARTQEGGHESTLITDKGSTSIDDGVVAKIAGLAAREVAGVHAMGGGSKALSTMRGMVGGDGRSPSQGVSVEVGERQSAVDLDLVVEYGTKIPDLAAAVRKNVINAVERMTGLEVTEVNIRVDDVHLPEQDKGAVQNDADQESRVR